MSKSAAARRPVTSTDVARLAEVSQSTVSRAFSETSKLTPETRKRVLDAARELGYRPNAIARSLVSSKTNIIGLTVMRNESPFYSLLVNHMASVCRDYGYNVMMIRQKEGESGDETVARALEYRVDGIVVTAVEDTESVCQLCRDAETPIILLNRYVAGADVDTVCSDNYLAGEMVVDYLAQKGHRTIACLMGAVKASTTRDRLRGMLAKAKTWGVSISRVEYGDYTYESGCEMGRKLMKSGESLPDAIFCSGDIIAFGVLDVLRHEFGVKVPEDVSVIGFDDINEASWLSYSLTTVRQPYAELVDTTFNLLMRRMKSPDESIIRALHVCEIVERCSVRTIDPSP